MTARADTTTEHRLPLTRDRVLRAAVDLADQIGIDSLSMRKLGTELGVEAMSLYNHVKNKDDLLDGMVETVVAEIRPAAPGKDWKATLRAQIISARSVLKQHPWALSVIETRTEPRPVVLSYMESVLKILREGGFSLDLAHHAMHVLGSRVLGFNQDLFDEADDAPDSEMAAIMAEQMATTYPYITELSMAVSHEGGLGGCDDDVEFDFGLDLIFDGLDRLLENV